MILDRTSELDLISGALTDRRFMTKVARVLKPDHIYDKTLRWIYARALDNWVKRGEMSRPQLLSVWAARTLKDPEEETEVTAGVIEVFEHKPSSPSSALQLVTDFVRAAEGEMAMKEAVEQFQRGEVEKGQDILRRYSTRNFEGDDWDYQDWATGFTARQAVRKDRRLNPQSHTVIPTGLKALDAILNGGLQPGMVELDMAATGRGKSRFAVFRGYTAALHGYNTVHIVTETTKEFTLDAYDAKATKFPSNEVNSYGLTDQQRGEAEAKYTRLAKKYGNTLWVVSVPVLQVTAQVVVEIIEYRESLGLATDFVIIDSPDQFIPTERQDSFRLNTTRVYWDIWGLAHDPRFDIALLLTTQVPKEWADKIATSEAPAESYDKTRIADVVFTLNQSRKQRQTVPVEMDGFLPKHRHGDAFKMIPLVVDYATCHFEERVVAPNDPEDDEGEFDDEDEGEE